MKAFIKKHEIFAGFLFLLTLTAVAFLPVIIGKQTLFSAIPGLALHSGPYGFSALRTPWTLDPGAYMWTEVPQTIAWFQSLHQGVFPFWNQFQGLGQPLSGDILAAAYNPLKLLLFGFFPYLKTFDVYAIIRVLIAGVGTFLFLKRLKFSQKAALAGAIAYMFSGYFMQWLTQWSLAVDMMVPWVLFGIELFFASDRLRNGALLALFIAIMVLGGNPEAVIASVGFIVFYFLAHLWMDASRRGVKAIKFITVVFSALVVAYPMLWDMYLFVREGIDAHASVLSSFVPAIIPVSPIFHILEIVFPPSLILEVARTGGLYQNDFVLPYFGVFVLLLAICGLSWKHGAARGHWREIFFGSWAAVVLLVIGGVPPFSFLSALPLVGKVIFLKYSATVYLCAAILAAFGFKNIEERAADGRRVLKIIGVAIFVVAGVALLFPSFRALYGLHFSSDTLTQIATQSARLPSFVGKGISFLVNHPFFYAYGVVIWTFLLGGIFFFLYRKRATTAILVILILEILLYMPKLRDGGFKPFDPFNQPPFIAYLKSLPDIDGYRIFATNDTLMPLTASAYGLHDLRTNDPTYLKRYISFLSPVLGGDDALRRVASCWCVLFKPEEIDARFSSIFNEAGVKYIISETPLAKNLPYKLIYDHEVKIYENDAALPFAYVLAPDGHITEASAIRQNANSVAVDVASSTGGILVINQIFYPGWMADVDGMSVSLISIKNIFQGIVLTPGGHAVTLSYSPFQ